MSSSGSVTHLFERLQQGERATAQQLWELYFHRLVGLARKKLGDLPRHAVDEEDVAISAFDSFCRGAENGRFPHLADRDSLWEMLVLITARKAVDLRQFMSRDKRDWRRVRQEARRCGEEPAWQGSALATVLSREPDPAFAAEVAEQCSQLLELLGDDMLRSVAVWKMEGYTSEEVAGLAGCSVATVERKLRLIRPMWEGEGADSGLDDIS